MNTTHRFGIAAALVAVSALVSVLAAPSLPDTVVTHWNAAGEPDGTMSKTAALALIPALSAVLVALLALVPRVDPLGENVADFRAYYDWFVVLFAGFMTLVHGGVVAFNLGYEFDFTLLVLAAVAGLLYYVGVLLTHAERNWFVGIRTPWTLSDETVWDRTHELGGRLFKLTAVVSLVGLLAGDYTVYFLLVPALATAAITVAYSYYLYERLDDAGETAGPGA
ncbi:SdpI family protein [Halosimplex pelagicum]|uniref:SdpI family protein n=1 Tax=Halosimplex pelagicum TaxID=869886 RepID=A0A7D5P8Q4_9EURY|nr:SdpI family protein [Halosimplex pelagicum]QLH83586.1 SdpI family protein [Halosimplex pelagicum]